MKHSELKKEPKDIKEKGKEKSREYILKLRRFYKKKMHTITVKQEVTKSEQSNNSKSSQQLHTMLA